MRFLRTINDSINIARIIRIAYLTPPQRRLRADKTNEPYWENPDDGEIIVDVGRAIPLVLGYVDDDDVGILVVSMLTDLITSDGSPVIDYEDVVEDAEMAVEKLRAQTNRGSSAPDPDDELDDVQGFEGVNGWSRDAPGDAFPWRQ